MEEKDKEPLRRGKGIFLGVCQGLGERYLFDPTPLRIILIILMMAPKMPIVLIYVMVAFLVMKDPESDE